MNVPIDPNDPWDGCRVFNADGTSWRWVAGLNKWKQDDYPVMAYVVKTGIEAQSEADKLRDIIGKQRQRALQAEEERDFALSAWSEANRDLANLLKSTLTAERERDESVKRLVDLMREVEPLPWTPASYIAAWRFLRDKLGFKTLDNR